MSVQHSDGVCFPGETPPPQPSYSETLKPTLSLSLSLFLCLSLSVSLCLVKGGFSLGNLRELRGQMGDYTTLPMLCGWNPTSVH
jgi:hypothetical protein